MPNWMQVDQGMQHLDQSHVDLADALQKDSKRDAMKAIRKMIADLAVVLDGLDEREKRKALESVRI